MGESKTIQPRKKITLRFGVLPFRWLQEQGHLFFQHLLQTLSSRPKNIDGVDMSTFFLNLKEDYPDYIADNETAKKRYEELVVQVAAVITDQESGTLVDTRPAALMAFRCWEERIQDNTSKEDSMDRKDANQKWKEWAKQSAANGAGKAHKLTNILIPWRPRSAKTARSDQQDALPQAILEDLRCKFADIWQPSEVPWPNPTKVVFPEWLPDPIEKKVREERGSIHEEHASNDKSEIPTVEKWGSTHEEATAKLHDEPLSGKRGRQILPTSEQDSTHPRIRGGSRDSTGLFTMAGSEKSKQGLQNQHLSNI